MLLRLPGRPDPNDRVVRLESSAIQEGIPLSQRLARSHRFGISCFASAISICLILRETGGTTEATLKDGERLTARQIAGFF